jgi:hypothetical protein
MATPTRLAELMKGGLVCKHVLGLDVYPVPLLDEKYVHRYLNCIVAATAET